MKGITVAAGVLTGAFVLLAAVVTCATGIYYRVADYRERRQAAREGNTR